MSMIQYPTKRPLSHAMAAYDQNALIEELLTGAIARLISVIESEENKYEYKKKAGNCTGLDMASLG